MKIHSATIGMESARTYVSISKDAEMYSLDCAGKGFSSRLEGSTTDSDEIAELRKTYGLTDTDRAALSESGVIKEDTSGKGAMLSKVISEEDEGNIADELNEIIDSMRAQSVNRMRNIEETTLAQKLKNESLKYLLRLMYGADWKEKYEAMTGESLSGYESGGSEGIANGTIQETYTSCHFEYESESTSFTTTGVVQTEDGRRIDFNITAIMSREYMEYSGAQIVRNISLADPLVINVGNNVTGVSDQTFYFDIDADGEKETLAQLAPGSGLLALDINGDGIVNDGSELFGALTGKGFDELARYDSDSNGWIDENDEVFAQLKVWSFDRNGEAELMDLKKLGIGAIYLGNKGTEFTIKNETGETDAVVRNTGMFLFENGVVGTVQQIDLARKNRTSELVV